MHECTIAGIISFTVINSIDLTRETAAVRRMTLLRFRAEVIRINSRNIAVVTVLLLFHCHQHRSACIRNKHLERCKIEAVQTALSSGILQLRYKIYSDREAAALLIGF